MKNILSYPLGTVFLGQEILNWMDDQIQNRHGNWKEAERLHRQYCEGQSRGFAPDKEYKLIRDQFRTRGPEQLGFMRVR